MTKDGEIYKYVGICNNHMKSEEENLFKVEE